MLQTWNGILGDGTLFQVYHSTSLVMRPALFLILLSLFAGCLQDDISSPEDDTPQEPDVPAGWEAVRAFPSLSFNRPVDLQHPSDGSGRLFVVGQEGTIHSFPNREDADTAHLFLDLRDRVDDSGTEEGLLGLAFHPDFESNGWFFVNYTSGNGTRISRFSVAPEDPSRGDPQSEEVILSIDQPYANHNGGQLAFGPDGYLYIALGDGGSAGDPHGHGQNRSTLLGTILRIDVNRPEEGRTYAIPPDNPFAGNGEGHREEIYAWGLRNPWRFSFDTGTGLLWAADVGQNSREEINLIESGGNYGWNIMEGSLCHPSSRNCDPDGLIFPVWEYGRDQGISVTGGFVYRGEELPELEGLYIYGDFGSGRIWALDLSNPDRPENRELLRVSWAISSFGTDTANELFICSFDGYIYRLSRRS